MKRLLTFCTVAALALTACRPAGPQGTGPIRIGFIGPLTGEAASFGVDTLNGVKLAVEELNAKGGISGRPIELIAEDGRCTPTDATNATQKLLNIDKVIAIIGGQCSGETLAAAPLTEAAKIILLSPVSSSPNVTSAGNYVFRNYPSDALKTKAMARYFRDKGIKRVAIISTTAEFSIGFRDALKKDIGDILVFDEVVDPDAKDFRSLFTRLRKVEFDMFVPNGHTQGVLASMVQQFREQGLAQPMISHDVADTKDMIDIAGAAAEGILAINVPTLGDDSAFGERYIPTYGPAQAGLVYAAHAYDAANVLFEAIQAIGTNGSAMKKYLDDLRTYSGIVGNFAFDENGDVTGLSYALKEVKNGTFMKVGDIGIE